MNEIWKDIKGYEGLYQVSSLGEVQRLAGKGSPNGRLLKIGYNNNGGYGIVRLSKGGASRNHYVHRLVAEAFLEPQSGKTDVNHIDLDKHNNTYLNLEWATRKENIRHAHQSGAYGNYEHARRNIALAQQAKSKMVAQYTLDGALVAQYKSTREAARITGLHQTSISSACLGKLKTTGGYAWKYLNEPNVL